MVTDIAIVGMSCRYPDARSPQELWENVLAQRQAFRSFPAERLRMEDYFCQDGSLPDTTYASQGAFIENYEFDRVKFRISGNSYRSSDLAHWLALDVASQALTDAGFTTHGDLPSETTGVIVGNTLTGEFSRAHGLRLRWPYVRRVVSAMLQQEGWAPEQCQIFLRQLEDAYKAPFAPVGEETLAGGLSNTIAGRICNYFNLKGGGYTVDGACASSLLAIATACTALANGDIDMAVAGGVDISLDPFELIGFAKTSALTPDEMRVYDLHSRGFIPGEGCGFVVLMRYDDALAQQRRIYALVRGWGISSDGSGGITRPEVEGQLLALMRAYCKAGIGIESISYFEGHGTGTSVGDATELQTLSRARRQVQTEKELATISSIKANIGHTKAAAGVAGFIKATMALSTQIIPPTTGTHDPHTELTAKNAALTVRNTGIIWPSESPLRAGVSAMGFGGINTHLVLEGISSKRRTVLTKQERALLNAAQDAELILLAGKDRTDLIQQVTHLLTLASRLSKAEVTDLALHLWQTFKGGPIRAAVVASSPAKLALALEKLQALLVNGVQTSIDSNGGVFLGQGVSAPRIGFLFPGQGAPMHLQGGLLRRRFAHVDDLYTRVHLPAESDGKDTTVAQPAIVTASLAALHILQQLGIRASIGIGHSLGELTALHWAGAFDEQTLLHLAKVRGHAMGTLGNPTGAMASIAAPQSVAEDLLKGTGAVLAGINAPNQTVISGNASAIASTMARARARQVQATQLNVSHAFHSPLVAAAVSPFADCLSNITFQSLQEEVISTVTGNALAHDEDLKALLCKQITAPVKFVSAIRNAADKADLLLEVGPGKILSGLATESISVPAIAIDAGGPSIKGLLEVVGASFALGAPLCVSPLYENRFSRPFDLNWQTHFFANPCEQAPLSTTEMSWAIAEPVSQIKVSSSQEHTQGIVVAPSQEDGTSTKDLVRQLIATRAELPIETVNDSSRMLTDLHLNSIAVGQIVSEAARLSGLLPPVAPTEFADATVSDIVQALEELKQTGGRIDLEAHMRTPSGVDTWIRPFQVVYKEVPLSGRRSQYTNQSSWQVLAPPDYPLAEDFKRACARLGGEGVLVCLPNQREVQHLSLLLQGAREVLSRESSCTFVLVQHGGGGAGIARTLYLEAPKHVVCVVDIPSGHPEAVEWVLAEIQTARGYTEALYDANGQRSLPTLEILPISPETYAPFPLSAADVLLVTGGGKGIAAECAFALAQKTGVRLALFGRSLPNDDQELAANLNRFTIAGIDFRYMSIDVTEPEVVQQAIRQVEQNLGPITALLHGAGMNTPKLIAAMNEADIMQTLAPKVQGLKYILSALRPEQLRLLVTFGSVIARTGMRGEADYALANDWLADLTETFQVDHPSCRCLCLEWSVWAGIGMGERLGRIEALMREGITPIPLDKGVAYFQRLLQQCLPAVRIVVTSRFGESPTLRLSIPDLPFLRFLEQPRVYYPGIELVADVELSTTNDLYLEDHKFRGERLLPAVVGLEAIAQVAMALTGERNRPRIAHVQLERPIVVPEKSPLKLRIAALVQDSGAVDVVLRSEETAFQVDHFRATCHFQDVLLEMRESFLPLSELEIKESQKLPLDPIHELYGGILFHQGRFQCVRGYYHLRAHACVAEILSATDDGLFVNYLPSDLILGDFVLRDAVIHAIQACIPHARLLPIAIEEMRFASTSLPAGHPRFVYAKERQRQEDVFTYDIEVRTISGEVEEQWKGLQLRQVEEITPPEVWPEALLGPYMEWKLGEFLPKASVELMLQRAGSAERQASSNLAFRNLLGSAISIQRRPDGKPAVLDKASTALSASHHEQLTFVAASPYQIGCDVEPIVSRTPSLWQDLLGMERYQLASFLTAQTGEELDRAATRVWATGECLKKAGAMVDAPLRFSKVKEDGWILLKAGSFVIATYIGTLGRCEEQVVFAVCSGLEYSMVTEQVGKR